SGMTWTREGGFQPAGPGGGATPPTASVASTDLHGAAIAVAAAATSVAAAATATGDKRSQDLQTELRQAQDKADDAQFAVQDAQEAERKAQAHVDSDDQVTNYKVSSAEDFIAVAQRQYDQMRMAYGMGPAPLPDEQRAQLIQKFNEAKG